MQRVAGKYHLTGAILNTKARAVCTRTQPISSSDTTQLYMMMMNVCVFVWADSSIR